MLRRLGVFAGRFELDAAQHVVAALGDFDAVQVFDVVSRLVDKSLVGADDHGPDVLYRMLETIRGLRGRARRWTRANALLRDADVGWWNRRLGELAVTGPTDDVVALVEAHHDDLVAAVNWATEHDPSTALDLSWPLTRAFPGCRNRRRHPSRCRAPPRS